MIVNEFAKSFLCSRLYSYKDVRKVLYLLHKLRINFLTPSHVIIITYTICGQSQIKNRRYHYVICNRQIIYKEEIDNWTACQFLLGELSSTHSHDIRLCLLGDCRKVYKRHKLGYVKCSVVFSQR